MQPRRYEQVQFDRNVGLSLNAVDVGNITARRDDAAVFGIVRLDTCPQFPRRRKLRARRSPSYFDPTVEALYGANNNHF
jgi:hypothetical protein